MDGFDAGWDSEEPERLAANSASSAGSVLHHGASSGSESEEKPSWGGFFFNWMALPGAQSSVCRGKKDARVKRKRAPTADLWKALDAAVHSQNEEGGSKGKERAQRSNDEILLAAIKRVRAFQVDKRGLARQAMLLVPKEASVLVLNLPSCEIMHAGNGFDDLGRWMCSEGLRGLHLTNLLHPDDAMQFKVFVGEVLHDVRSAPCRRAALASQLGKTQRIRMLIKAPAIPGGEAPDWALVYAPALTFTVARVEHTKEGGVVAVFTVNLRPADDPGINTKRCVESLHELIRAGRVNREYTVDWGLDERGMNVFAFGSAFVGWGLGSKAALGGAAGRAFAAAAYRSLCAMASWMVKKVLRYRLALSFYTDSEGRPCGAHVSQMSYVGGGGYSFYTNAAFGNQLQIPDPPSSIVGGAKTGPPLQGGPGDMTGRKSMNFILLHEQQGPWNRIDCIFLSMPFRSYGDPRRTVEIRIDSTSEPNQMTLTSFMPWASGSSEEDRVFAIGPSVESLDLISRAQERLGDADPGDGLIGRWIVPSL